MNGAGDYGCGQYSAPSTFDEDGLCGTTQSVSTTWSDHGCGHNDQRSGAFDPDSNCARPQGLPGGGTVYAVDGNGGARYVLPDMSIAVDPDESCGLVISGGGATDQDGDCRAPAGGNTFMEDNSCGKQAVGGGTYPDLDCGAARPGGGTWPENA